MSNTIIRLGSAALNQTPMDWEGNTRHIQEAIKAACAQRVHILCLPEMAITGYGCEDWFQSPELLETAWEQLKKIVHESVWDTVVTVGLPVFHQNAVWNCVAVCYRRSILGLVAKQHLAGDGIHYEHRWFRPWPAGVKSTVRGVPIGDLMFDFSGVKLGLEICESAWVNDRPGRLLAQHAVDIILNPSASHFAFGKTTTRQRLVAEGSRSFGCAYAYANLLGNESGRVIYDGETMIASGGEIVARGPRLTYDETVLTVADVDVAQNRMRQARTMSFTPDLKPLHLISVETDWNFYPSAPTAPLVELEEPWEKENMKEEEFTRAVSLGLFDYLRKSHTKGFALSLSGGADSSACAVLIKYMTALSKGSPSSLPAMQDLLTCAYQGSANSGPVTLEAAEKVAEAVGARFYNLDIQGLVQGYTDIVEQAIGRKLTWEQDDIPLQNLQARVRAPSIWMFANIEGKLLLTTANRSEMSVGYSTMDGDTAGGLAPLAGIDKDFVRSWLVWVEKTGPYGLFPIPELSYVNKQQPTAELRPGGTQTDEDDLMPYYILNACEKAAVRDKRGPSVVLERLHERFPEIPLANLRGNVAKYFRLWCQSTWKREKSALSFHLDDENLDPRSWCRFPTLSSGFKEELAALR